MKPFPVLAIVQANSRGQPALEVFGPDGRSVCAMRQGTTFRFNGEDVDLASILAAWSLEPRPKLVVEPELLSGAAHVGRRGDWAGALNFTEAVGESGVVERVES